MKFFCRFLKVSEGYRRMDLFGVVRTKKEKEKKELYSVQGVCEQWFEP